MSVWMRSSQNPKDVVMSELQIELLACGLHTPTDVGRRHKEV
jgi:hypothetical protein